MKNVDPVELHTLTSPATRQLISGRTRVDAPPLHRDELGSHSFPGDMLALTDATGWIHERSFLRAIAVRLGRRDVPRAFERHLAADVSELLAARERDTTRAADRTILANVDRAQLRILVDECRDFTGWNLELDPETLLRIGFDATTIEPWSYRGGGVESVLEYEFLLGVGAALGIARRAEERFLAGEALDAIEAVDPRRI